MTWLDKTGLIAGLTADFTTFYATQNPDTATGAAALANILANRFETYVKSGHVTGTDFSDTGTNDARIK